MLGYLKDNRDFFKGNFIEFYLKKAVAFSGGSQLHYEYFKAILNYSIINMSTYRPLHDSKAGQFTLHLFPLKTKVLLSIVYYKYELNLVEEYKQYKLDTKNILLPSTQLQYNNIITDESISEELLNLVDDVALNNRDLNVVFDYLNLNNVKLDLNNSLLLNLKAILSVSNLSISNVESYINLVNNNDRLQAIILSAKQLNYKPQSVQYLSEALTKWHQISST